MSDLLNSASLVLIPSGYKEDTVYSVVPSDGSGDLSFTRASNGTRVNSAGLVEVCPWNFLEYSEDFANAWWQKDPGSSVDSNVATAPNGTSTADRLNYTSAGQGIYRVISFSGTNKLSVYLKGEGANIGKQIQLEIGAIGGFNVTLTGDWVRHEVEASNATSVAIKKATSGQADAVLAWGIQVNSGSTAKPYFPTTDRLNVPRLTYQNGGGGCPSLLLEKQSTNIVTYSEDLTNWILANSTVTANATTSPDGTTNADKLIVNNGAAGGYAYQVKSTTSGTIYTGSFYIKAGGVNYTKFYTNISGSYNEAVINLITGAITNSDFAITPTTQNVGNGWYRVNYTVTSGGGQVVVYIDGGSTSTGGGYTGNGVDGVFVWGAQCEASSYATSYIPTTSASATRVADACSKTGISSLIGQTEGTIFLDFVWGSPVGDVIPLDITGSDGKLIWFRGIGVQFYGNGTTLLAQLGSATPVEGTRYKSAFVYGANDFKLYRNGVLVGTDTSGTFTGSFSDLALNSVINETNLFNQVVLFKTKLTDSELIALTS